MKLFIANEAKLIAKSVNSKAHKNVLEPLMNDAMYLIQDAAKRGKYELVFELGNQDEAVANTFDAQLQELGYKVSGSKDERTIRWI